MFTYCRLWDTKVGKFETGCVSGPEKKLSLGSLITWNITKVLEACPYLDLKRALVSTQERMERDSQDGAPMVCLQPEEQHLASAVMAWHRLGHGRAASLYEFIKSHVTKYEVESVSSIKVVKNSISKIRGSVTSSSSFDVNSIASVSGPVVRLPLKTQIVMRVENNYQCQFDYKSSTSKLNNRNGKKDSDVKRKRIKPEVKKQIKDACTDFGIDKEHLPKLAELEETISDLRTRAANLSRRKAERIELLERTDVAWKDLELGYERRLKLAEEKAKDTEEQIKRILDERNGHKSECKALVEDLKRRSAAAEAAREGLTQVDKQVCGLACERLRLSDLATKDDGALAAEHCRRAQLEREFEFKEQAERRKIQYLESEISTARGLTLEAERAARADMAAVQDNLKQITDEINKEKNKNEPLKAEIANLQTQKVALTCDLDNCKMQCGEDMQRKIDVLKSKKNELATIKEKVLDCQCKLPIDASTEAKRTPSLAAYCGCGTDNDPKSCSCTSLRQQLMSNLLGSLFEGLMSDLCATGSLMPCQLLKCLDDGHDWERDSTLRTNIHSYCSQLFIGELNIAITTTIEECHTKWHDGCEADKRKSKSGVGDLDLDSRAKKLAAELVDQMFSQKADDFSTKATPIMSSRQQPCHCKTESNKASAVYPLLVKPPTTKRLNESSNLKKTINDVAQLREQIEVLKKKTIGKEDLKVMEEKLRKIINRASTSKPKSKNKNKQISQIHVNYDDKPEKDGDAMPVTNRDTVKIKEFGFIDVEKKLPSKSKTTRMKPTANKDLKNITLPSAVDVYICDTQKVSNSVTNVFNTYKKIIRNNAETFDVEKCRSGSTFYQNDINDMLVKEPGQIICSKECICINKIPSNTSINELLESLTKTETYYQNHKILQHSEKSNNKNSNCFLNKKARPPILENIIRDCNSNDKNEKLCSVELLNADITGCPENDIIKTCDGRENMSIGRRSEKNIDECKTKSKEIIVNEYGTPIKDNGHILESKGASISDVASTLQSCVCCNDESLNTREIEINALNLLKKHIQDKIKDLRPSSTYPIPADEEKGIYEDILKGIKKIITNGTFELLCKCSFKNHEGSRHRAYTLLKEYLKIKIKRAQCSCTTKYDRSEKLLIAILNKITELIERDFERLKLKYQEKSSLNDICSGDLKKVIKELSNVEINGSQSKLTELDHYNICGLKEFEEDIDKSAQVSFNFHSQNKSCDPVHGAKKMFNIDKQLSCILNPDIYFNANTIDEYTETFYTQNIPQKKDNKSAQVYFNLQNKSSEILQIDGNNDNIDKKVSCTLGNDIYITDCNCRYNIELNDEDKIKKKIRTSDFDTGVLYFDINDNFF